MIKEYLALIGLVCMFSVGGCDTPPPTVETGPYLEVGGLEIAVTVNSNGDVVLSGEYNQHLTSLGPVGIGWKAGFDKVLYEAARVEPSLFVLWEDESGGIWKEQYLIGQPFDIEFTSEQWVREIKSTGDSIIVAVVPVRHRPDYEDLRSDVRRLVERWDQVHYEADRYWDTGRLSSVLSGAALAEQRETVDWLQSNNCYWETRELMQPEITYFEVVGSRSVVVDVRKNWDMDLYCNGEKNDDDDGYFTVRYNIDQVDGQWYITEKRVTQQE
jgi:hypothetical protein